MSRAQPANALATALLGDTQWPQRLLVPQTPALRATLASSARAVRQQLTAPAIARAGGTLPQLPPLVQPRQTAFLATLVAMDPADQQRLNAQATVLLVDMR